jgi:hypothetical protein
MRTPLRFLGIVLLLALGGGCDTTQPLQIDSETYQLEITGESQVRIPFYNVYYMVEDGVPDQVYLFCTDPVDLLADSVPWNFSLTVEVLRNGETVMEEIVISTEPNNNLAPYDDQVFTEGIRTQNPITFDTGTALRTFRFMDPPPRRLAAANDEVMAAVTNPLFELDDGTYGIGTGLCSLGYPGEASINGVAQPITIELNKGDTLVVQARKGDTAPPGTWYLGGEPKLKGELLLNGLPVQVNGTTISTTDTGDGISFSFTAL